jgi:hypothetical protein
MGRPSGLGSNHQWSRDPRGFAASALYGLNFGFPHRLPIVIEIGGRSISPPRELPSVVAGLVRERDVRDLVHRPTEKRACPNSPGAGRLWSPCRKEGLREGFRDRVAGDIRVARVRDQSSPQSWCFLPVDAFKSLGSVGHPCILSHTYWVGRIARNL